MTPTTRAALASEVTGPPPPWPAEWPSPIIVAHVLARMYDTDISKGYVRAKPTKAGPGKPEPRGLP